MINTFENIIIEIDCGYFFSYERNGLYRLNFSKWETELITVFEEYPVSAERLFSNIVKIDNWLILIPMQADAFVAYNIDSFEKKYIAVPKIKGIYKDSAKFLSAFSFNHRLYVIGHSFPGIVKIDLDSWNADLLIDFSEKYSCMNETKDVFRYCKLFGKEIFAASACDNSVLIFDPNTEKYIFKVINCEVRGFATLFECGEDYVFVSQYEKSLVKYNCENNMVHEFPIVDGRITSSCSNLKYSNSLSCNEYEIIVPLCNEQIIVFNHLTEKISFIEVDIITRGFEESIAPIRCAFSYEGHIYILSGNNSSVFEIDMQNMRLINTGHRISARLIDFIDYPGNDIFFVENMGYNLEYFVDEIC